MPTRKIFMLLLTCMLIIGVLSPYPQVHASEGTVKIATDEMNIRTGPGLSYPILGKATRGETYPLIKKENDWLQIKYNGQKGWVADWLVTLNNADKPAGNSQTVNGAKVSINTDSLRVRSGAGTDYRVLGTLSKGSTYTVVKVSGNWIQLDTPFGQGWVAAEYVQGKSDSNQTSTVKYTDGYTTVNVRNTPSKQGAVIGKLQKGTSVKVLSENNGWVEISYSGQSAWVSSEYISKQTNSAAGASNNANGGKATVTATSLSVREAASLNAKVIGSIKKGQSFQVLEENGGWFKIEFSTGSFGWAAGWFMETSTAPSNQGNHLKGSTVTIQHDGTNIRKNASTTSAVVQRPNKGDIFEVINKENDWFEVKLADGSSGFVAGWLVAAGGTGQQVQRPNTSKGLKNKTIVLDPGHGGRDNGTTGNRGTLEKRLTLQTANLLADKLRAAGAKVILTRTNDTYISLDSRVRSSHMNNADAFISIHYDSITDRSVRGLTTYYYHGYQQQLAADIHSAAIRKTYLKDRGHKQGDYFVLRENNRKAVLIELGYLSNPAEEMILTSKQYQEAAASGIFEGISRHFN